MPEPDFDQMADDLIERVIITRAVLVEQLRVIWNARGAADEQAVERRVRDLVAGEIVGAGLARHVAEAIRKEDR